MSTIRGNKQEIKPGLFSITRDADGGGQLLAFFNETEDTQFNVCYIMPDGKIEPLGKTQVADGGKYAVSLYPQETVEFIKGTWRTFKRSISFGAPDKEWQLKQATMKNKAVEDDLEAMRAFVKANPRADGKYTAEYMAELCVQHQHRFVDLTFAPTPKALARDWEPSIGEYAWGRPESWCGKELQPALFVGDVEPNDIDQGLLGDCYYLCCLACIAEFPLLIRDAFSLPQNPELGLYRVLVCKNGWWQVVLVDDYLPTKHGKPCFARNREEPNELWVSLLEKAYAKLHGSYSAIRSGDAALAIADLLGAPYKKLQQLPEWAEKPKLFQLLKKADEDEHLMAIGTPGLEGGTDELSKAYEEVGLATGHAYSLLRVKEPQGNQLCMIRNPWGDDKEWNGAWSDDSPLWTPELQKEVGFYKGNDGTFWMQWEDVVKYFDNGSISMVMREWPQVRVTGNFVNGVSDIMMLVTVTAPAEVYLGWHQRDRRGLPTGDKDSTYVGMLLSVVHETSPTERKIIVETANGTYQSNRDGYCTTTLQPSAAPYMVLIQPFNDNESKSFTASLFIRDPTTIKSIDFVSCSVPEPKKYSPASRCKLSDWSKKAAAKYQVRMTTTDKEGMALHAMQGEGVEMKVVLGKAAAPAAKPLITQGDGAPNKPTQPPPATKHADPMAGPIAAAPTAAPAVTPANKQPAGKPAAAVAPQPAPVVKDNKGPTAPKKVRMGAIKLHLIIMSGRNLVAKDSNGLSDPYVTVKLKTPQGDRLSEDQRVETRYIKETLNPVWAEVFRFELAGDESLCIKCWDKDTFGHDLMGVLNLNIADVVKKLTAGGPATLEWYKLSAPPDDVSGDLQLAFSWMI
jgi:hypothetical protein